MIVGAENLCRVAGCSVDRRLFGSAPRARAWDDLRLVGLKLIFLVVSRAVSLLRLSRREWWQKDAEILMLRHQLAVAERDQPRAYSRLTWPDLCVPKTSSMGLTIRVASRPSGRDDHRSCACASSSS
jgi:hypothetical protein